jgi:hypothetical protein
MTELDKKYLAMKATRLAKSSEAASQKSEQLSKASGSFSQASVKYSEAARQAEQSGSFIRWLCFRLYSRLMLVRAKWLIGKSVQLTSRARAELQKCDAIIDSLGIKRDA